jgi:hypothetical protein
MRLVLTLILMSACGSSSNPASDAPAAHDSKPIDAKVADAAHVFMDGPSGTAPLTVKNYLAWCSISVNGGATSAAGQQIVNVMPGSVALVATPASATFAIGPTTWHDTAGDTGTGDPGTIAGTGATETSSTTVTVGTTAKCVWACCPFANGTGCPTAEQCP